jgi:hypothetical protein
MTYTQLNIGLNLYGYMYILIPCNTPIPYQETFDVTTTDEYKSLELYEGLYKNNEHNILLCNLEIPPMKKITISLDTEGRMTITAGSYVSDKIQRPSMDKTNEHIIGYKAKTDEWKQLENGRMKYLDYIYETKDTLFDPYVKKKIPPNIYDSVICQFNKAEQICYVKDITLEEITIIHKQVEDMVNKVLNDVVIENNGEHI